MLGVGLFGPSASYYGCASICLVFSFLVSQNEHHTAHQRDPQQWPDTHTLGCPLSLSLLRPALGVSCFLCVGTGEVFWASCHLFYCSKSWAKHLNLYLSKITFGMKPVSHEVS